MRATRRGGRWRTNSGRPQRHDEGRRRGPEKHAPPETQAALRLRHRRLPGGLCGASARPANIGPSSHYRSRERAAEVAFDREVGRHVEGCASLEGNGARESQHLVGHGVEQHIHRDGVAFERELVEVSMKMVPTSCIMMNGRKTDRPSDGSPQPAASTGPISRFVPRSARTAM